MSYGLNADNNLYRGAFISNYTHSAYSQKTAFTSTNLDLKLRVTIADYSKRCCLSQLIHRIVQAILYVVTFGHTQWNATKKELTATVKKDLQEGFKNHLIHLFTATPYAGKFANWNDNPFSKKLRNDLQGAANNVDAVNRKAEELARSITKRINVSNYVNQFMNDLLKVNTAPKKVFATQVSFESFARNLNFASLVVNERFALIAADEKSTLADEILKKEAKSISKKLVTYITSDRAKQSALIRDKKTFSDFPLINDVLFPPSPPV